MSEPGHKAGCLAPERAPGNTTSQMLFPEADKRPDIIPITVIRLTLKKLYLQAGVFPNSKCRHRQHWVGLVPPKGQSIRWHSPSGSCQCRAGPGSKSLLKFYTLALALALSHHRSIVLFVFITRSAKKEVFKSQREPYVCFRCL